MAGAKESLYYDEAERLYVAGHTLERISELLPAPVSLTTLSRWKQKGDWDGKRRAALASLRNVAEILQEIVEEKVLALRAEKRLDTSALDAICKATASIERLKRGAYDFRTAAVEVMGRFSEWLRGQGAPQVELQQIAGRMQAWFKTME